VGFNQWFKHWGVPTVVTVNHLYALRAVLCATCPGAEAVRGWRHLNRPTVCTVGAVAPGAGFLRFKTRVSQVQEKGGANCRTRDNKLEEGDFQEA
jgi:hypothetical protein